MDNVHKEVSMGGFSKPSIEKEKILKIRKNFFSFYNPHCKKEYKF